MAKAQRTATCTECRQEFPAKRVDAKRCSDECRRRFAIRRVMETRDPAKHCEAQKQYYQRNKAKKAAYDLARKPIVGERRKAQHRALYQAKREHYIALAMKREARTIGGSVTAEDLRRLFLRAGGICDYCAQPGPIEVEHRIPISRGGLNSVGNLAAACRPCNRQKSDKTVMEWRVWKLRVAAFL